MLTHSRITLICLMNVRCYPLFLVLADVASTALARNAIDEYNWTKALAAMYAEIDNSLAPYQKQNVTGENFFHSLLKDSEHTVWIIKGEIFVDKKFLQNMRSRAKKHLHLRLMWSILKHAKDVLNFHPDLADDIWYLMNTKTAYTFSAASSGTEVCRDSQIPLVIAKKHGYDMCGILLPNPYFGDLFSEWGPEMKSLMRVAAKKVLSKRIPVAFWRGKITNDVGATCEDQAGNFARISAAALTLRHSEYFDARSILCEPAPLHFCNESFKYTSYEIAAIADGCRSIQGEFLTHDTFSNYKFLLSLPGAMTGSYSKNQNHVWLMGSVVLLWSGPLLEVAGGVQWYSPALSNGHTHLVISRETGNLVQRTLEDEIQLKYLVQNAHDVAERILCPKCIAAYTLTVLGRIRNAFPHYFEFLNNGPEEGADVFAKTMRSSKLAARRWKTLIRYGCKKYQLYKVIGPTNVQGPEWSVETEKVEEISACELLYRATRRKSTGS